MIRSSTGSLVAFYHVAAMGNWRQVVVEQLEQFVEAGLESVPLRIGFNGSHLESRWLEELLEQTSLRAKVIARGKIEAYEKTTLRLIAPWVMKNKRNGKILYFHTKGVSAPDDDRRVLWRRFMAKYVIAGWSECVKFLDDFDLVGAAWHNDPPCSHFSGNFWWARADWLAGLPDFDAYYSSPNFDAPQNPELACEFWISSNAHRKPRVKSFGCVDNWIWNTDWLRLNAERLGINAKPWQKTCNFDAKERLNPTRE